MDFEDGIVLATLYRIYVAAKESGDVLGTIRARKALNTAKIAAARVTAEAGR